MYRFSITPLITLQFLASAPLFAQSHLPGDSIVHANREFTPRANQPLLMPPADKGIRSSALLGALIGGVAGTVVGLRAPCRGADGPPCQISGGLIGLGAGVFAGNIAGASIGGGITRCGYTRGIARATAGAAIASVPFAAYAFAVGKWRVSEVPLFFLTVSLPFFQAEGAARAVSGC